MVVYKRPYLTSNMLKIRGGGGVMYIYSPAPDRHTIISDVVATLMVCRAASFSTNVKEQLPQWVNCNGYPIVNLIVI